MCGIAGYTLPEGSNERIEQSVLEGMSRRIAHRGPDGEGFFADQHAGLAHRRLSVIDPATGAQPMSTSDGRYHLVFNGEIYNHRDLRRELERHGHHFHTDHSDSETLLHGLRQWGIGPLCRRLDGMFAFAIWDQTEKRLYLARDRTGEKPLFIAHQEGKLAFSSEIKALLPLNWWNREIDREALHHYLTLQYVPAPFTIYRGVRKLLPAHYAVWSAPSGKLTTRRYWKLRYTPKTPISEEEAIAQLDHRLERAVATRLEADVPLGCWLSGGIDSSAVVALMRRVHTGKLLTFSIGFEEEEFNELPFARRVAERYETDHEVFILRPDIQAVAPRIAWHFDEPFADPSAFPTYFLSEMTRNRVTVALSGDGGDESFAGYRRYHGFHPFPSWEKLPRELRLALDPIFALGEKLLPGVPKAALARYVNQLSTLSPQANYAESMVYFTSPDKNYVYTSEMQRAVGEINTQRHITIREMRRVKSDLVDQMMASDIATYLPGALLPKVDRTSMSVALEVRAPFLSHELMGWAAALPSGIKFKDRTLKYLLKKTLEPLVPHECLYRRKTGFGVPTGEWIRGELRDMTRDLLLGPEFRHRGFFSPKAVEKMLRDHLEGRIDNKRPLWALLCFEQWARVYIDGNGEKPA